MKGDCQTHSDCDYFHCKGRCDLIEGKCSDDGVVNDNLQAICENVFLGKSRFGNRMSRNLAQLCFSATGGRGIKSLLFPGLLSSRHMNVELRKTLEHCANPSSSSDGTRIAAGDKTKKRVRYKIIGMQCVNSFACDQGLRLAQGGKPHRQAAQVRGEHRPHLSLFIT